MELDIRQNNELIMDINSDKEKGYSGPGISKPLNRLMMVTSMLVTDVGDQICW